MIQTNLDTVMHYDAIMALADALGGTAAATNLDEDHKTTPLESKSNFLWTVQISDQITGKTISLQKGCRTTIWQTTVAHRDGKSATIVT